ncbi:MAG: hypothetical protein J6M34_05435 [Clostridia bacterium]|nr:hypothetical protein [Clostridia bacterium]
MGKHSAPTRSKKKRFPAFLPALLAVVAGIAVLVSAIVFFFQNPYESLLEDAGVAFAECEGDEEVLKISFNGDAEGILQCRKALNALREGENPPETVEWTLLQGEEILTQGTVEHVGFLPAPESPRVETMEEDLTVLKLKYELEQSGLSVKIQGARTQNPDGKALTVTVNGKEEDAKNALSILPAALRAMNGEGGGIVRVTVLFYDYGTLFAAADYDLAYGDVLLSSKLAE